MAWYKYFSVEVPLLFLSFSMILQGSISTNLYMYRTCYTLLGYPEADCAQLGNNVNNITKVLEPKVQPTVNYINMVQNTINNIFPVFVCMYVGTWSDKFGRKPFLLLTISGIILSNISNTIIVYFKNASTWWFIVSGLPSLISGGFASQFIVISAYLIDVSTEKDRAIRLSAFELIMGASSFVGNMVSARILYATSYEAIFMIAVGLQIFSLIYTIFVIPESVKAEKKLKQIPNFKDIWDNINFKQIIQESFRKREKNINVFLYSFIAVTFISGFAMGEMQVSSLYLRAKLSWTLSQINLVGSITSVGMMIGTMLGTFLLYKTFKIKELPLALFAVALAMVSNVLRGIATNDIYIYAANAVNIFNGVTMLMWRTVMSYMLKPDEMGKIFALMNILSSLINVLSSLAYPAVYNATLDTNSGIYNFMTCAVNGVVFISILILSTLKIPRVEMPPPSSAEEENQRQLSISINTFEVLSIDQKRGSKRISLPIDTRIITDQLM
ncbi:proton-coupled folate transporter isoform X2 [Diabrotica virgifera virgifera]|uniref:Proton-coupled folate transporter-like n=1 Tax=Diabrotica virgifera virgifera TaxID=50390 RepID=A0A6P7EZF0_DIAVI|nr:proton-coupled folate transporter isoform X2 [Diabrotica virgifera virgifera]